MGLSASMGAVAAPRQRQAQRLGARMRTYLRLLAKPLDDLRDEVRREVESNPAIDDVDFSPFFRRAGSGVSAEAMDAMLANVRAKGESLEEHLRRELRLSDLTGPAYDACLAVIENLDEHGRFVGSIPDMLMVYPDLAEGDIETARQKVMTFDPLGCGARTAEECLLAQLPRIPPADRASVAKVIGCWNDLLAGRLAVSAIDPAALVAFRRYKGRLVADPGAAFEPKRVETIRPDVTVDADGAVSVDSGDIPEIRISTKYLTMARDRSLDAETRAYAQERIRHAKELQTALVKRLETMETIAEKAIGAQKAFLEEGERGLKKLTMSEVAKEAGCDVSTVSRAAARKFVKTPRGVVPLRTFFSLVDHEPIEKLREILAEAARRGEKPSDSETSKRMAAAGYPMARRTVAKYRAYCTKTFKPSGNARFE